MKREAETSVKDLEDQVKNTIESKDNSQQQQDQVANSQTNQGAEQQKKLPKKIRVAFICGYNGNDFCGSQKNKGVRSVEEELEKALYKNNVIASYNFGDLKKIGFGRATRTDKRVHALQNVFSCKIQISKHADLEEFRHQLNKSLPHDVKVFCIMDVANRFNAKNCTSYREYSYYLPTFMLRPLNHDFLGVTQSKTKVQEAQKEEIKHSEEQNDNFEVQLSSGVKRVVREKNQNDEVDPQEHYLSRDISHISKEKLEDLYGTRMTEEQRETLTRYFQSFLGTKKYHNYTKEVKSSEMTACRYMMDLTCDDFMYVNQDTLEISNAEDKRAIEFVHFYLQGQSFLYNQIRKMVGCMIQVCRGELNDQFVQNTHKDNHLQVALAPGDGLLLEKVAYDRYNDLKDSKKNDIMLQRVCQTQEVQAFREKIVSHIASRELKDRAFTCWLSWFDDNRADYYIDYQPVVAEPELTPIEAPKDLSLLFIGNPLLDISVDDPSSIEESLMKKYTLELGQACLASEQQMPIYDEVLNMKDRKVIPGGSALNSSRAAAYFIKNSEKTSSIAYMGCIGQDETGQILETEVRKSDVIGNFFRDTKTSTGTCAVVIKGKERSLCANIAASAKFPLSHLQKNMHFLENAQMIYSTSFFITSNFDALLEIGKYCAKENKPFAFNLSAVFLLMFNKDQVLQMIEYADYIFANEDEADAYATAVGKEGATRKQVAEMLANTKKINDNRQRVAIVTQGPEPVIVAIKDHKNSQDSPQIELHEVPKIDQDLVVDTNGAGDAFVGAFLARLAQGHSLDIAVKAGAQFASAVVQRSGATFPDQSKRDELFQL